MNRFVKKSLDPALVAVAALAVVASHAAAQVPLHEGEIAGVVRSSEGGAPLAGAAVVLVGSGRAVITHADGRFHIRVPETGSPVLRVERLGYRSVNLDVADMDRTEVLVITLEPAAVDIAGLVVTGSITERGADETLHPVNVLTGEELQRRLKETLAATLASEPGLTSISMGPATARPVIRGMSGDRVLILEDGQRVGDVSNSGSDHATGTDASTARRVEVVRGPAALMYGSNALGGVVNVIRDEIPADEVHHLHGTATLQTRTVNAGTMGSVSALFPTFFERVPARVEFSARTAGDLKTPQGILENTFLDTWSAGGGAAFVDGWGSVGGAFRYMKNDYGIPGGFVGGHAQGVRVEQERSSSKGRLTLDEGVGPFRALDVDVAHTWYRHSEIEPPDILGTFFKRQTLSADVVGRHGGLGALGGGAAGLRTSWERHDFAGSLSTPDAHLYTLAGFVVEEVDLGRLTLEAGARYDWTRADPIQKDPDSDIGDIRTRTFHAASGSLGVLFRVAEGVTLGASVARAFRTPDINELYSEGPHLASYSFEVGNPDLGTEVGTGLDAFLRVGAERLNAEVSAFHNVLTGYIYPRETGDTSRTRLPVFQFTGEDATLSGFEGHVAWNAVPGLVVEGTGSYVRGTLTDTDEPLPLMPPFQGRASAEFTRPAWFVRGEAELASRQDRVGAFETPTDGYAVFNAVAGVRLTLAGRLNALTVSLENLTDKIHRNHLSRVKAIMPEAGRGLNVTYRVVF